MTGDEEGGVGELGDGGVADGDGDGYVFERGGWGGVGEGVGGASDDDAGGADGDDGAGDGGLRALGDGLAGYYYGAIWGLLDWLTSDGWCWDGIGIAGYDDATGTDAYHCPLDCGLTSLCDCLACNYHATAWSLLDSLTTNSGWSRLSKGGSSRGSRKSISTPTDVQSTGTNRDDRARYSSLLSCCNRLSCYEQASVWPRSILCSLAANGQRSWGPQSYRIGSCSGRMSICAASNYHIASTD